MKHMKKISAKLLGLCLVGLIVALVAIGLLSDEAGVLLMTIMVVAFIPLVCYIDELRETDTKQQTQIDTLTRELEEVKRKLEK